MSVINKALSELDKRKNNTQYGRYVPAENKNSHIRIILVTLFSVAILVLAGTVFYRFGFGKVTAPSMVKESQSEEVLETKNVDISTPEAKVNKNEQELKEEPAPKIANDEGNFTAKESLSRIDNKINSANQETVQQFQVADKDTKTNASSGEEIVIATAITDETTSPEYIDDGGLDVYGEVEQESGRGKVESAPVVSKTNSYIKVSKKQMTADEQIKFYRSSAERSIARGDTEGAITAYRNILSVRSADTQSREKLAGLYFGSGRTIEAVKVLDQGIRVSPAHYDFRLYLARIYSANGRNAEAIKVLNQAVPPVEGNVDYYATLAGTARDVGDYASAENAYRRLAASGGRDGKWYLGLAIVQEKQGRGKEALASYKNAGKLYLSKASRDFIQKRILVLESIHHDR